MSISSGYDNSRFLSGFPANVLFWTAIALASSVPAAGIHQPWTPTFLTSLAQWWAWGLLSPLIIGLDRRLTRLIRATWRRYLLHLAIGIAISFVQVYLAAGIRVLLQLTSWSTLLAHQTFLDGYHELFWCLVVYYLIIGFAEAYHFKSSYMAAEVKNARLERASAESRLLALRAQLDPHFLFNALNTISSYIAIDPKVARKMLEHVGDLLRSSLGSRAKSEVPLAEELAFLEHYLAIQRARFAGKLRIDIEVPEELSRAATPALILQPLVENSIRHGIAVRAREGTIWITARRIDDRLELVVSDDGVGLSQSGSNSNEGLGLSITRERIATIYQGHSAFQVSPRAGGGAEARMSWPLRMLEVTHAASK